MGLVIADFAQSYDFTRRTEDSFGHASDNVVGSFTTVVDTQSASPSQGDANPGFGQQFTVFIESAASGVLQSGDLFTYQTHVLRLVGYERASTVHPLTGDDMGWIVMTAQRVGTSG